METRTIDLIVTDESSPWYIPGILKDLDPKYAQEDRYVFVGRRGDCTNVPAAYLMNAEGAFIIPCKFNDPALRNRAEVDFQTTFSYYLLNEDLSIIVANRTYSEKVRDIMRRAGYYQINSPVNDNDTTTMIYEKNIVPATAVS